jgi:hypothetical protein
MSNPEETIAVDPVVNTIEYSYFKVILSTRCETEWAVHVKVQNDRPGHFPISGFLSALKSVLKGDYKGNTVVDAIDISKDEYDSFWLT